MSSDERVVELMGTTAHIIVTGGEAGLADRAVERLDELEDHWSRFRPDSEVSLLNAHPGEPVLVSPDTFTLVERALAGWHLTGGRFDPTMLRELREAGYDRSFDQLADRAATDAASGPGAARTSGSVVARSTDRPPPQTITLDPVVGSVRVDPDVELDPGGIGKGLAADMVVELLLAHGASGALVSIGGDLRAEGESPEGRGWVVAVADPTRPDTVVDTLALRRGAIASTWRTKRSWTVDGSRRHHLLDPTTGAPASTGLAGVTVVGRAGWHVEVLAKAAYLASPGDAARLLTAQGAAGIAVADDGSSFDLGEVEPFTTRAR